MCDVDKLLLCLFIPATLPSWCSNCWPISIPALPPCSPRLCTPWPMWSIKYASNTMPSQLHQSFCVPLFTVYLGLWYRPVYSRPRSRPPVRNHFILQTILDSPAPQIWVVPCSLCLFTNQWSGCVLHWCRGYHLPWRSNFDPPPCC